MFVWISSATPRIGCCGVCQLMFPLALVATVGGIGFGGPLLMLVLVGAVALFLLPRLLTMAAPVEPPKNDDLYDAYSEKPKRDEGRYTLLGDDQIIRGSDYDDPNRS